MGDVSDALYFRQVGAENAIGLLFETRPRDLDGASGVAEISHRSSGLSFKALLSQIRHIGHGSDFRRRFEHCLSARLQRDLPEI